MRKLKLKLVQVRLGEAVHKGLEEIARDEGVSITDILRKSIQFYAIGRNYRKEGKTLVFLNPKSGEKVEVLIPGITPKN